MISNLCRIGLLTCILAAGSLAQAADTYAVDGVHSSVSFMIEHAGISYVHGRFNDFSGKFTIDPQNPAKSSFALDVKVDSVDTNNAKRDEHLRAPDYFNTRQYPLLSFRSTSVTKVDGGYEVTGDLTLHGVKKPITLMLKGGDKVVEVPKGTARIGLVTNTSIKRSDFDMKTALGPLGDEILIYIGLEAVRE